SGVLLTALMPDFSSFSAMTGSAYMLTTSRWTLSTMARGVPAGATNPIQVEMSSSAGMPASTASGLTSGKAGSGRLLSLASARNLPLWMSHTTVHWRARLFSDRSENLGACALASTLVYGRVCMYFGHALDISCREGLPLCENDSAKANWTCWTRWTRAAFTRRGSYSHAPHAPRREPWHARAEAQAQSARKTLLATDRA